jgi:hypothetical protein
MIRFIRTPWNNEMEREKKAEKRKSIVSRGQSPENPGNQKSENSHI